MYYEHEELEYDTWIVRLASNVNSHKSPLIGTSSLSTLLSFFHSLTILVYEEKSAIIDIGKLNDVSIVYIIYSIMVDQFYYMAFIYDITHCQDINVLLLF